MIFIIFRADAKHVSSFVSTDKQNLIAVLVQGSMLTCNKNNPNGITDIAASSQ